MDLAFTLAFATDHLASGAGFFVCQHHHPENFWDPAFQRHRNGATGLGGVAFAAERPLEHRAFLEAFSGAAARCPNENDLSFGLARGRIDVLTPDDAAIVYGSVETGGEPGFVAFTVDVAETGAVRAHLDGAGIPYQEFGTRLVVPASAAHGVAVAFEPA